jgi:hypothetical protein
MHATAIERATIVQDPTLTANAELVAKSSKLLSYNPGHIAVFGPLATALSLCDIKPLDRVQVERYMASKEYKSMTNITRWWTITAALWAVSVTYGVASTIRPTYHLFGGDNFFTWLAIASICLVSLFVSGVCMADADETWTERTWHDSRLSVYQGAVPSYALAKAVQLAESMSALNQPTFIVHRLVETHHSIRKPLPDPFLQVKLGNESFYIDVWEEPEFEKTLYVVRPLWRERRAPFNDDAIAMEN